MDTTSIILVLVLQYSLLILVLLKKPNLINSESDFGVVLWIPIIGPVAVVLVIVIVLSLLIPLIVPWVIANSVIWVLNRIDGVSIEYID